LLAPSEQTSAQLLFLLLPAQLVQVLKAPLVKMVFLVPLVRQEPLELQELLGHPDQMVYLARLALKEIRGQVDYLEALEQLVFQDPRVRLELDPLRELALRVSLVYLVFQDHKVSLAFLVQKVLQV